MQIKDLIRTRREELGLTYEALGKLVGVGKSTVRKWETGIIENMRRDNIIALSKALNISPSILMGWEDYKEESKAISNQNKITEKDENKLSEKEQLLLDNFNKLNDLGKKKVINYTKDLTELNKYITIKHNFEIDTIAAHNDYLHIDGEMENIMKDLEDMDNW